MQKNTLSDFNCRDHRLTGMLDLNDFGSPLVVKEKPAASFPWRRRLSRVMTERYGRHCKMLAHSSVLPHRDYFAVQNELPCNVHAVIYYYPVWPDHR